MQVLLDEARLAFDHCGLDNDENGDDDNRDRRRDDRQGRDDDDDDDDIEEGDGSERGKHARRVRAAGGGGRGGLGKMVVELTSDNMHMMDENIGRIKLWIKNWIRDQSISEDGDDYEENGNGDGDGDELMS